MLLPRQRRNAYADGVNIMRAADWKVGDTAEWNSALQKAQVFNHVFLCRGRWRFPDFGNNL
jgi:hypothetical protein